MRMRGSPAGVPRACVDRRPGCRAHAWVAGRGAARMRRSPVSQHPAAGPVPGFPTFPPSSWVGAFRACASRVGPRGERAGGTRGVVCLQASDRGGTRGPRAVLQDGDPAVPAGAPASHCPPWHRRHSCCHSELLGGSREVTGRTRELGKRSWVFAAFNIVSRWSLTCLDCSEEPGKPKVSQTMPAVPLTGVPCARHAV